MSANAFSLVYDGPPVAEGTIDARDLAPALLALADLIDEAAPVVDPELPRLSLRVRPDFREGSFEVYLELANLYSKFVSGSSQFFRQFRPLNVVDNCARNGWGSTTRCLNVAECGCSRTRHTQRPGP